MSKNAFAAAVLGAGLGLSCATAFAGEVEWRAHMDAGTAAYQRGDFQTGIARLEAALKEAQAFDERDPRLPLTLNNLALLYTSQGRYADAEPLYRRSLAIWEMALGAEHPNVADSLNNLAFLYRRQKRIGDALTVARRASAILAARFASGARTESGGGLAEQRTKSLEFEQHVGLLYEEAGGRPDALARNGIEALNMTQLARASDTADQVAKMAVRYAAGSDALAQLARQRQDLLERARQIDELLVRESSKPPAQRNAQREARVREEGAASSVAIAALDARLAREFPQYRELTSPEPLALGASQKLLAADEALVALLVAGDESFLWVVRRNEALFERLSVKRSELDALVRELRGQLDLGGTAADKLFTKAFDTATANEIYRRVFAPGEKLLAGARHLIVVPDGALQSLPLGVLVTELPAKPIKEFKDNAAVAWLAKKYAITTLPAVGSLRALRAFARATPGTEPFTGFGDPELSGRGGEARRANLASLFARGAVADVTEVRNLDRLPDIADELRAIGKTLGTRDGSICLGAQATETRVKSMDLTRVRNLAFATHGLTSGDLKGFAEPSLVLTPPAKGTEQDDGMLTASEISQLKLNADWVILSACNTAAADGTPGTEGLSGLAKAFFYAGARSLLVSHWSVSSDAAVALTTRMFEETAKGASKAEALRRSMLALMQSKDKPHMAHPAFWAPFVVVGEGNEGWAQVAGAAPTIPAPRQ